MHETLLILSFVFIFYFFIQAIVAWVKNQNEPLLISWGCAAFMAFNWFFTLWRN